MRRNIQKFILVHAAKGDSGAKRPDDDYDIWDNKGEIVGRVFRAANAPKNQPWFWLPPCKRRTCRPNEAMQRRARMPWRLLSARGWAHD
jgi:hypothetical protein